MGEMEVIRLQTGCKGEAHWGCIGVWDSLLGRGSRKTPEANQGSAYFDT
jgi:hypothetical protein